MSNSRLMTWQKATALVPLALLSGAWTASLAGATSTASAASDEQRLPDGTSLPSEAIEAPASVSVPGEIAPGIRAGSADRIAASSSTSGIPDAALAAYQRAAQVIDTADKSCNVDWTLIAAIGRVESDHGRYGGNTLSDEGVSTPGIYGIPLDGSSGTAKISDTDAGELDDDPVFDRAIGPMQFIPSTWSVVGVDGDGDGVRNPQDIDDAALATAVYLCSGTEDLSTTQGLRTAVYRYNHSQEYVDLVLSIMKAYAEGDYSSVPNGSASPATFSPVATGPRAEGRPSRPADRPGSKGGSSGGSTSGGGQGGSGTSSTPTGGSTPTAPAPGGGTGGTGGGSTGGGGGGGGSIPTDAPTGSVTEPIDPVTEPVVTPLEQATAYCQNNLTAAELNLIGGLGACTDAYLAGGAQAVQNLLSSLLNPVTEPSPPLPGLG